MLPFLSVFGLALLLLILLVSIWWYATMPPNLPPGPRGLPLLGSIIEMWSETTNLHTKLHDWTKKYGSPYCFYIADKLVLVLGDWRSIQEALVKQGDAFAGRPVSYVGAAEKMATLGLVRSEGELWKTQRRFALSTLRDLGLGKPLLEAGIKEETNHLVRAIDAEGGRAFDPSTFLMKAVCNVICTLIFGHRFEYEDATFQALVRLASSRAAVQLPFLISKSLAALCANLPRARKSREGALSATMLLGDEIEKCKQNFDPGFDEPTNYIHAFCKARHDRRDNWTFTDLQLIASIDSLFFAGTNTTATTLCWCVFYLAHNPSWQDKIYDEIRRHTDDPSAITYTDLSKMPLTEAVIMETQRFANMFPLGVFRRTLVDCKLDSYDIPADTVVVPLLTAALRDPDIYPRPEEFDPNRFLQTAENRKKGLERAYLIPFQAGRRVCLGQSLSKMELFHFFTALMSAYKFVFSETEPVPAFNAELVSFSRRPVPFKIRAVRRS